MKSNQQDRWGATQDSGRQKLADKTHDGFLIKCRECGSETVIVESDVGFSELSGAWGGVQLKCCDCQSETEIWNA